MNETPTPRTDAESLNTDGQRGRSYVRLDFARQLERELAEAKAKADNSKTSLLAITSGHFYQSSCRGGEMERLMNQAIEALGGGK